ncbi:integrase [Marinospirillum celere]|uniref:Integrase n=1 Tax=Marinospirillum celere TaxID=1122252 RepID=A0A1I1EPD9_9GAMM|nr:DUF3596 domain-containing protein [Marinospirillum celere]SFB87368.1 integrase [Marinospirillum celere]
MASVRSRGKGGNLFIDFRYQGMRCREQTLLPDTTQNRRKLEKLLQRIEAEISVGTFDYRAYFPNSKMLEKLDLPGQQGFSVESEPATPLFKDFCEEWFEENQICWKRSYMKNVRGTLDKHLIPEFGDQEVASINKAQVLKFRASLAKVTRGTTETQLSNDRINHIMTPLRMILENAADRFEFITPMTGIKPLKVGRTDVDPFSLIEVQKILKAVREDYKNYFTVRFFTGLRTAEVDGLQWQYVDFDNRQILVRETVVQGRIETTKTPESRREVEMSSPVYEALKRQSEVAPQNSRFVFCNSKGKPFEHRNVTQRVWYPLLKELGLKKRRPYQTRHTAATLWLAAGENPEWIARQMGHTTTQMLFTIYSRYVPNLTRQDGSAIDQLLMTRGFANEYS